MSVNKVILVGRLGAKPEMRYSANGLAIANFRMATDSWVPGQNGEQGSRRAEWHRVVAFGKLAETCGQYLDKGKQVYVEGRIQTREWQDKEGQKRWTTEIVINEMRMLGSRGDSGGDYGGSEDRTASVPSGAAGEDFGGDMGGSEDDLPF